jgi:hypothetical protein
MGYTIQESSSAITFQPDYRTLEQREEAGDLWQAIIIEFRSSPTAFWFRLDNHRIE